MKALYTFGIMAFMAISHLHSMEDISNLSLKEEGSQNQESNSEFQIRLFEDCKENTSLFNSRYSLPFNFPEELKKPLVKIFPQIEFQLYKNQFEEKWGYVTTYDMNSAMPSKTDKSFTWIETDKAGYSKPIFITRLQPSADGSKVIFCTAPLIEEKKPLCLYLYDSTVEHYELYGEDTSKFDPFVLYAVSNKSIAAFLHAKTNSITLFDPLTHTSSTIVLPFDFTALHEDAHKINFDFNQQENTIGIYVEYVNKYVPQNISPIKTETYSIVKEEFEKNFYGTTLPCTRLWYFASLQ